VGSAQFKIQLKIYLCAWASPGDRQKQLCNPSHRGEPSNRDFNMLETGWNFRDIGGLAVAGEKVRCVMVYRPGRNYGLSASDQVLLNELGIRLICDFRGPTERCLEPVGWRSPETDLIEWEGATVGDLGKGADRVETKSTAS
jgi:hypothetical protein